jgi:vacuolar-type H+-ATPase subunit I/STV1
MTKDFISIKDASEISGKSIQTIRRMIKSKKIKFKKEKTPQGFNYLIDLNDMIAFYNIDRSAAGITDTVIQEEETTTAVVSQVPQESVSIQPAIEFNNTMSKLIDQHSKEKENLFNLIENFQNKVVNLENQLKIERLSKKAWWKFW